MRRSPTLLVLVVAFALLAGGAASARVLRTQPLSSSFCSPVFSGSSSNPDFIVASEDALQNGKEPGLMAAAIRYVLSKHHYRAGRYSVGYQSCSDSTPQMPEGDPAKCASNAKAYAADASVIAVIGAWFSVCSKVELPILGSSRSGPLVLVSPANTSPGLTHHAGGSTPGEPGDHYSGTRNYVRLEAPDDFEGIAAALLAKRLHLHRVFVLDDATGYGLDVEGGFTLAARNLGVSTVGSASWDPTKHHFGALARRVARSRPSAVLLAGSACPSCGALLEDLRKAVPTAKLVVPDAFPPAAVVKAAGSAAEGMYFVQQGLDPTRYGRAGQLLQRKFGIARPGSGGAPAAAQAVEVVLASIARSSGTRASVTAGVKRSRVTNGVLGTFHFDANGDMWPAPVTIYRVVHGRATVDLVVQVSSRLLSRHKNAP